MVLTKKELVIRGSNTREMGMDIVLNSKELTKQPVVIFCHGYKGFKDWGCWNLVADLFVVRDLISLNSIFHTMELQ